MTLRHIVPTPIHDQNPSGASRFVTSGEIPVGAGTGDAVKASYNLWTGPSNVWTTPVTFSGVVRVGQAVYAGSITGANRLVSSGELSAGGGTGDATRTSPNYFTALNVFNAQTTLSGVTHHVGSVAISGGFIAYTPLLDNAGRRFLVSGEGGGGAGTGDATRTSPNYFTALNVFAAQTTLSGATHHVGPVAISGGAISYTPMQDGAGRRYLVSGEVVPGAGDFVKAQSNYVTGSPEVFVNLSISGALVAGGGTQISGTFTTYGPLLTAAGQRFVTSGEIPVIPIIPSGITTINAQTGPEVTINTGTAGNDFNVSTGGNIVTVNLPTASPFARGKMTFGAQTFSGTKNFADPVVALGGVQISGVSVAYQPIYGGGAVASANRLVTSGELALVTSGITTVNAQTGPALTLATGSTGTDVNLTVAANVLTVHIPDASAFARGVVTTGAQTISGSKTFAAPLVALNTLQLSGVTVAYAPIHAGAVGSASRYVTSGDMAGLQASLSSSGITTLNSLTAVAQSFATGSTGTDFNISSVTSTHTFHIPSASNFSRGLVTPDAQTISGAKAWLGPMALTDGVQISGVGIAYRGLYAGGVSGAARYLTSGEVAVIPSGLTTLNSQTGPAVTIAVGSTGTDVNIATVANVVTIHVPDASAFARGVLTTTAQTISGVKQFADSVVALATMQTSGVLVTYAGAYGGSVSGATRFVTSGELSAAGTGDFVKASANYVGGSPEVFAGLVAISGSMQLGGGTQVSGITISYVPLWQRTPNTAAARYVTSGELTASLTTLNSQTGPTVSIAVGSAGTDFAVSAGGNVVTLDLPSATQFARGVLTTTPQTLSGVKTFVDNVAVRGATQLSGLSLHYAPVYQGIASGAQRYVVSGELGVVASGITTLNSQSGPAVTIAAGSAGNDFVVTAAGNVVTLDMPSASAFARGLVTIAAQTLSGVKTFADNVAALATLQASGTVLSYAAIYGNGILTAANRYVTSGEVPSLQLSGLSADGHYTGITDRVIAGTTLAFGQACYEATTGQWHLTRADAAATAGGVRLGVCVLAASGASSPTTMLVFGKIRADAQFPTLTIGAAVYLSATTSGAVVAGAASGTTGQPSGTDHVIRVVGHAETADAMVWSPSPDYITHT